MDSFNRLITKVNRKVRTDKKIEYIVIHYVGAVSSAYNNAKYFEKEYRGASAHYFVDENSIWQVVEDKDDAWHVGTNKGYKNDVRNWNSIGIELCCKNNGNWYFEPQTIDNAIWLTKLLMKKYNIPIENVTTHYLTTGKICPEPFVREPALWQSFLSKLEEQEMFVDEEKALDYLVEKNHISNKEYWQKALAVCKNLNFLIIKYANTVRELEMKNGLV
jgi:N-acetylmuramoyl-L-alanine amidase CwlA